jgi:hypothetical protein
LIDAGPGVEEPASVRRESHRVGAIPFRQDRESGAVEVHPAQVQVVGILSGLDAAREEPDLPGLGVHGFHTSDDPFPAGDLILHLAGRDVVEPEMAPAVAFGHPQQFTGLREPFVPGLGGPVDEGGAGFVGDDPGLQGSGFAGLGRGPGPRVDAQHAKDLMATLVVDEAELAAVRRPLDVQIPRFGERCRVQGIVDVPLAFVGDREHPQDRFGQLVAGLEIAVGVELGLDLVLRKHLDKVDDVFLSLQHPSGNDTGRVRCPGNIPGIGIIRGTVGAEGDRAAGGFAAFPEMKVVVPDEGDPPAIRRFPAFRAACFAGFGLRTIGGRSWSAR